MQDRIKMNTESLQEKFNFVYQEFFSKHDIVASASNVTTWLLWISSIKLCQKVPTKNYCWVKIISEKTIKFWKVYSYIWTGFEELEYTSVNKKELELIKILEKFLNKYNFQLWLEINFLSENPRWHWFGFSWVSWALISYIFHLIVWLINMNTLENYDDFLKSNEFDSIHRLAWKLDYITKYWESIWSNSYFALLNYDLPMLYLTEKYDDEKIINDINYIDWIKKYAYKIKDFLWIQWGLNDIPLDYWIIFSWTKNDVEQIANVYSNYLTSINEVKQFMKIKLNDNWIDLDNTDIRNDLLNSDYQDLKDIIYTKFWYLNIFFRIMKSFELLFKNWFDDIVINNFLSVLKMNNHFYSLLENSNEFISIITEFFIKNKKNNKEDISIFPINTWKLWWSYVFVTKYNLSRNTIEKVVTDLKNIWYNWACLEYASWLDWKNDKWITLEQYISKWIYSKYVTQNNVMYINSYWDRYIWEYNDVLQKEMNYILLDKIGKKIYIKWRKLTSQDISSQSTTIEVLELILENIWKIINNNNLSPSSYSKNKNEMLGKIVLPFIELVRNEFWENIPLICKWSLNEFYLKMDKSNIRIWLIKKIG